MNNTKWHGTCNAHIPKTTDYCQGVEFDNPADMTTHLREVHNRKPSKYRAAATKLRLQTGPTKGGIDAVLAKYADAVEFEQIGE